MDPVVAADASSTNGVARARRRAAPELAAAPARGFLTGFGQPEALEPRAEGSVSMLGCVGCCLVLPPVLVIESLAGALRAAACLGFCAVSACVSGGALMIEMEGPLVLAGPPPRCGRW